MVDEEEGPGVWEVRVLIWRKSKMSCLCKCLNYRHSAILLHLPPFAPL